MAQWNRTDRTLYAKLVYYGPALGGKTTNLQALHHLTDPAGKERLVAINTADDRTLFFDLLPIELGSVFGYRVAIKLFTVPGQVRYDATRRVVLAGADAVVFVADSDRAREADNRQAWDNLRHNLRANHLDPVSVPTRVQFNKRDLPAAAPVEEMERWFGLAPGCAVPAVASAGEGVLETLVEASRDMLTRLWALAEPAARRATSGTDLPGQIERAFAPFLARRAAAPSRPDRPTGGPPIVLESSDVLESAVATSVALGEQVAEEHGRAQRLSLEAESLRRLSETLRATGSSFDRGAIVEAALDSAVAVTGAATAALVATDARGLLRLERSCGLDPSPLLAAAASAELLLSMVRSGTPSVVDDLSAELPASSPDLAPWRAVATVPIEPEGNATLLVAMPSPDGVIGEPAIRFLSTLAAHLAVGLDKARIYAELAAHRDRLEDTVRGRTRSLRKAYDDLKVVEAAKDRFLANVSHEMRTPITAIIGAATVLRDCRGDSGQQFEMVSAILSSSEALGRLVEGVLRVARLEGGGEAALRPTQPAELVAAAFHLCGATGRAGAFVDPRVAAFPADLDRLAHAVANLLDNAFKFGPTAPGPEVTVAPCVLARPGGTVEGVAISVLDRGPGVPEDEVARIFAPFEQGGDPMTGKPPGVGLGLYEARRIARHHGGTLVYLRRQGGGSEFRISLPGAAAAAPATREARYA